MKRWVCFFNGQVWFYVCAFEVVLKVVELKFLFFKGDYGMSLLFRSDFFLW